MNNNAASEQPTLAIPPLWTTPVRIARNESSQLVAPGQQAYLEGKWVTLIDGRRFAIVRDNVHHKGDVPRLHVGPGHGGSTEAKSWLGRPTTPHPSEVSASLAGALTLNSRRNGKGLRPPQIGAVYAVLAEDTTGASEPVTIVLPTGVGKTEVMITLFAHFRPRGLLVLVPTDVLRTQIGNKFAQLGLLREFGMLDEDVANPVTCLLRHGIDDPTDAERLIRSTNVVVATPQVLHEFNPDARRALTGGADALYIDEAHHVPAATWSQVRDDFEGRTVVQFTATPFRNDGRRLGGRIIYSYPLGQARRKEFFANINYGSVFDLREPDRAIAQLALDRLAADLDAGRDHILFARANTKERAAQLLELYQELAPDLNPQMVHSGVERAARDEAVARLRADPRLSRVLVCVDMFGEGFDLPQLKVAALHDPHRSLGITLQFIGRFARVSGSDLGDATVIAIRPDRLVDHRLLRLYSEDADWNELITDLSETSTDAQRNRQQFESGFVGGSDRLPMHALQPRLGAVIYTVAGANDWEPDRLTSAFPAEAIVTEPAINRDAGVAWIITTNEHPVEWADGRAFEETTVDLHLFHFDNNRRLLYVNSTGGGWPDRLAEAVTDGAAERVTGLNMFRVFGGLERPIPLNLGLLDLHSRDSRYMGLMGANVTEGLSQAQEANKTQTHMYVSGYRNGEWDGIGASANGRMWRTADASIDEWMRWVNRSGGRVLDQSIDLDAIMRSFIRPVRLDARPELVPLALEWPWEIVAARADGIRVSDSHGNLPLAEADLIVTSHERSGPITFDLVLEDRRHSYDLIVDRHGTSVAVSGTDQVTVTTGRNHATFGDYATEAGLLLLCEGHAIVTPAGLLLQPDKSLPPYPTDRLVAVDWNDINIGNESMGHRSIHDSGSVPASATVQGRMFDVLTEDGGWDLIINDDGSGEVSDLVALGVANDALRILLVHCKYASGGAVGRRMTDLYEVCGQASKSTRWFRDPVALLERLIQRERHRQRHRQVTGMLRGTDSDLYELAGRAPFLARDFTVAIAQPGLTADGPSEAQLALLASTDDYVRTTSNHDLVVYCSGGPDQFLALGLNDKSSGASLG